MAYNKEELYKQAIEILNNNDIMFIEHLVSLMPCAKPTFYDHLPIGSNELNAIKELIEKNRTDKKSKMYKKWFDSDHPTLQVALMKLISTEEEAHRLNGTRQEFKVDDKRRSVNDLFPPLDEESH